MVVVPVIITPQRPVALVRICPHGWGPFKLGVIPDKGEQPIVGDVKRGELGGGGGEGWSLFFSGCSWGRFWPLF